MFNKKTKSFEVKPKQLYIVELSRVALNKEDKYSLEYMFRWLKENGIDNPFAKPEDLLQVFFRLVYVMDHMRNFEAWRIFTPSLLRTIDRLETESEPSQEVKKAIDYSYEVLMPREWLQRLVEFEPVLGEQYPSWVQITNQHHKYIPTYSRRKAAFSWSDIIVFKEAPVSTLLVLFNLLVFLLVNFRGDSREFMNQWGLSSGLWLDGRAITQGYGLSLISHMFLHQGWMHLIANMVTLVFVGPPVEQKLGRVRYFGLYLFAGVVGGLSHILLFQGPAIFSDVSQFLVLVQTSPENMYYYYPAAVGASGAISGVLAGVVIMYPNALLYLLGFIRLTIPQFTWGFLVVHIVMLVITVMYPTSMVKVVAWHSHLVGFLAGYIWVRSFYRNQKELIV